jgi:hypothetical protein
MYTKCTTTYMINKLRAHGIATNEVSDNYLVTYDPDTSKYVLIDEEMSTPGPCAELILF